MNIAFQFIILILQNCIFTETNYITVFETFSQDWQQKVIIFVDVLLEKCECTSRIPLLESQGRLDKTMYGESSVCQSMLFVSQSCE